MNDCGEKPGQLMKLISAAKIGELIDCRACVIWISRVNNGVVFTIKVNTANAAMAANSDTWNRNVRYSRFGGEVVSFFAACCAASFTFLTGFSPVSSDILSFLIYKVTSTQKGFFLEPGPPVEEVPHMHLFPVLREQHFPLG